VSDHPDFVIIGSGIGGATMAKGLAPSGAKIVILERGERLRDGPETRDLSAIFKRGAFRPKENWLTGKGERFNPGNFYNVGGNSKFYGAVMYRYRAEDFEARAHLEGTTQAWPFAYDELEPWYCRAEALFAVRGTSEGDPTEPYHSQPYPFPPVPHEPSVSDAQERLRRLGLKPSPLPLAVDLDRWLKRANTPWDGVPDTFTGKIDAETGPLTQALAHPNVTLETGAQVMRLEVDPSGREVSGIIYRRNGGLKRLSAKAFILACGAVNSAIVLQRSDNRKNDRGLANSSGVVGRYFMNHNTTAMITIDPRVRFRTVYQKTLGLNDFYVRDAESGVPLGNVQLLGKVSGPVFKANVPFAPEFLLEQVSQRAVDWYLMSEDLPSYDSRVFPKGEDIVLDWQPTNLKAHGLLVDRMHRIFRAAGYPIILTKPFGNRSPSHQCGTVRMGLDPASAALDPHCRSYDHPNLYVVDASFLPTSAAVNPALTIAAQALRVADRILRERSGL
jgi:choline dehydrogenase-like flavoprotein